MPTINNIKLRTKVVLLRTQEAAVQIKIATHEVIGAVRKNKYPSILASSSIVGIPVCFADAYSLIVNGTTYFLKNKLIYPDLAATCAVSYGIICGVIATMSIKEIIKNQRLLRR